MLNPVMRAKRLRADFERVRALHDRAGLIAIEQVSGDPPDRYLIRFTCRGIAGLYGSQPVYTDVHRVQLTLTDVYPTDKPLMEWLTPIFHPNIRENGQEVCIGRWFPAKTLDQLVLMLGEMIQYKNYASHDPLHLDASLWAMANKHLFPVDPRILLDPRRPVQERQRGTTGENEIDIRIFG